MKSFFRNNKGVVFIILVLLLPIILGSLYFCIDYSELKNAENCVRYALISSLNQIANSEKKSYKEHYKLFINKFIFELSPDNINNLKTEEENFSDPVHKCAYKCSIKESFFKTKLYEQKYNTYINDEAINYYKSYVIGKVISGIKVNNNSIIVINADNFKLSDPDITTLKPPLYNSDYGSSIKFFSDHPYDYSYKLWKQPWIIDGIDLTSENSIFNNKKFKGIFWDEYITDIYTYRSISFDLYIFNLRSISSDLVIDGCSHSCYLNKSNEYIRKFYITNQTVTKDRLSINLSSLKLFINDISDEERNISGECIFEVKRYTSSRIMTKKISLSVNVKKIELKNKTGSIAIAFPISSANNLKSKINKFLKNLVNKVDYKVSVVPFSPNIKLPDSMINTGIVKSFNNFNDSINYKYAYIYDYFVDIKILYSELIKIGTCGYTISECRNCRNCSSNKKFPVLSYDGTDNYVYQSVFSMIRNANNFLGHYYNSRGFNVVSNDYYSNNFFYYPIPTFIDNNNILYFGKDSIKNNDDDVNVLKDDKCFISDSYNKNGSFGVYGECKVESTGSDNWLDEYAERISRLFSVRYLNSKIDDKDYFFDEDDELELITNDDNVPEFWDSLDFKESYNDINNVFNKCIIIPYVKYKSGYINDTGLYINGFKNDIVNDKSVNVVCINQRKIDVFSQKYADFNTFFVYGDDKYKIRSSKSAYDFVDKYINNGMTSVENLLFADPTFLHTKKNNYPVPYIAISTFSDESTNIMSGVMSNSRFLSSLIRLMKVPKFWKFCPKCSDVSKKISSERSVYCNKNIKRCYNKFLENSDDWILSHKKDFYNNSYKKIFDVEVKSCSYSSSSECRNGGFYKKNYYPGEDKLIQKKIIDSKNGNVYQFNESICGMVTSYEIIGKILKDLFKDEDVSFIDNIYNNIVVLKDIVDENNGNNDSGVDIHMTIPIDKLNNFIEYIRKGFYLDDDNFNVYDRAVYKEFLRGIKKIDIFTTVDDIDVPAISSGAFSPYDYRDLHGSIEKITVTTPYDYVNYSEKRKDFGNGEILKSNISPIKYIPFNFSQSTYFYVINVKDVNPDTGMLNVNSEYIQDSSEKVLQNDNNVVYVGENLTKLTYPIDDLYFLNSSPAVGVGETCGVAVPILKNSENITKTTANGPYTVLYVSDSFPVNPYAILPLSSVSDASAYISMINSLDVWKSNFNHLGLLWAARMLLSQFKSINNVTDGPKIIVFFITNDDEFADNELTYYGFFNDEKNTAFPTLTSMKSSDDKQKHTEVDKVNYKNFRGITKDSLKKTTNDIIEQINSMDGDDKIIVYVIDTRTAEDTEIKSILQDKYFHATDENSIESALDKIQDTIVNEENYIQNTKTTEIKISE